MRSVYKSEGYLLQNQSLKKYPISKKLFEQLAADILEPYQVSAAGNRYVLVVRDFTT